MLKTISPLISPELLKVLAEMGHGDEIIFSDAHFPAHSMGPQVIRADGLRVSDLLQAIIPLFELDSYAPPVVMMAAVEGDALDPTVEQRYRQAPRSTAYLPFARRSSHSSAGIKTWNASSSLRVERLGASDGNFSRGMPI